jgi:hypothetical protein
MGELDEARRKAEEMRLKSDKLVVQSRRLVEESGRLRAASVGSLKVFRWQTRNVNVMPTVTDSRQD